MYIEEIKQITVSAGSSTNTVQFTPPPGTIVSAIIYPQSENYPTTGLVRTRIAKASGTEIAKMQPLKNFRSREVPYDQDGKPLLVDGEVALTWTIFSTADFDSDFTADLVLRYLNPNQCTTE